MCNGHCLVFDDGDERVVRRNGIVVAHVPGTSESAEAAVEGQASLGDPLVSIMDCAWSRFRPLAWWGSVRWPRPESIVPRIPRRDLHWP